MAWYARDLIMGKLSTKNAMKDTEGKEWSDADFNKFFENMVTVNEMFRLQGKYTECMMQATGYGMAQVDPLKFTDGINKTFDDWAALKLNNIMSYRDHAHASLVTGTMSPKPNADKVWLNNKWEDDIEFYKNMHK
jgi:trimethylamine monooxygenase